MPSGGRYKMWTNPSIINAAIKFFSELTNIQGGG